MSSTNHRPLTGAGIALGIGMGGFLDGIVFHQILQLHNMLSSKLPPTTVVNLEINMFWDGLFHAVTWTMTAVGLALLWRAVKQPGAGLSGKVLLGAMTIGWGLFNVVEGIIDHYILQIHHVVERGNHALGDAAFLVSGIVLIVLGLMIKKAGVKNSEEVTHA